MTTKRKGLSALTGSSALSRGLETLLADTSESDIDAAMPADPYEEETDEEFLRRADEPVEWIGEFGYNDHGVCVRGAIEICEIRTNKVYACGSVAQTSKGWDFGYEYRSRYDHPGSMGSISTPWIRNKEHSSQLDATVACYEFLINKIKDFYDLGSSIAKSEYQKVIDQLQALYDEYLASVNHTSDPEAKIVATKNTEPADPKKENEDPLRKVVEWIGPFGYNECNVCIEGYITVCDIQTKKIHVFGKVAQTVNGWDYGYKYKIKLTHCGSPGGGGPIRKLEDDYSTQEQASVECLSYLIAKVSSQKENAPPAAEKEINNVLDKLHQLYDKYAYADPANPPAEEKQIVVTKTQAKRNNPPADLPPVDQSSPVISVATKSKRGQPAKSSTGTRNKIMKMRCTEHVYDLVDRMAKLEGCTVSDLMHKALKVYPKFSFKLNTQISQEDLDKII